MAGLSTLELSQLRGDAEDYLPDTCTIRQVGRTADGQGGQTETWSDRATGVICRLAPVRSRQGERIAGAQMASITRWVLTIPYDQTIEADDRVVHDSTTYEVAHLEDMHSQRTAKRIYLRRLE